jgi:transposase-like protein
MRRNRIQFQDGLTLDEFNTQYGTDEQCKDAFEKTRWPDGVQCPKCESSKHYVINRGNCRIYQCCNCRAQTSLTAGTIFNSTNIQLRLWFQLIYLIVTTKTGISNLELKRKIGVTDTTLGRMRAKLQQVMYERELSTKLNSLVQVDDSYMGGEHLGGKAGRGSENKIPFIAAVQINESGGPVYVKIEPVKTFSNEEVLAWANRSLVPGTIVVSDGLACFSAVTDIGCIHEPHVVGTKQKSTSMECFLWINTVLGNLKTSISGTYHAVDFKRNAFRYFAEFTYLFNRRFDLSGIMPRLIRGCAITGSRTEADLRLAVNSR